MLWAREGGINIRGVEQVVTCSILQVFVLSGFRKFQPSLGDNNLADGFAISLLFPPQTSPPCGPAPGCTRSRVWSAPAAAPALAGPNSLRTVHIRISSKLRADALGGGAGGRRR